MTVGLPEGGRRGFDWDRHKGGGVHMLHMEKCADNQIKNRTLLTIVMIMIMLSIFFEFSIIFFAEIKENFKNIGYINKEEFG